MTVDALLEGRLADKEGEGLLVSCGIWLGTVRADTQVGKGELDQRSVLITKSSDNKMWASRRLAQADKSYGRT